MGRLDVRVIEARNLGDCNLIGTPDPYCKVACEGKEFRTETCKNSLNPQWGDVFKFQVADENSSQLVFRIFNDCFGSDTLMGTYALSLSGFAQGQVVDEWVLCQAEKGNPELHVRVQALDFGSVQQAPQQGSPYQQPPSQGYPQQPYPGQQQGYPGQPPMQQGYPGQPPVQQGYPGQPPMQQGYPGQPPMQQGYPGEPPMQQGYPGQPPMQQGYPGQPPMQQGCPGQPPMHQGYPGQPPVQQGYRPPSEEYADGQEVFLKGPVTRATYGPEGTEGFDYTQRVQRLIAEGKRQIFGGIHTEIGDPAEGVPKKFRVWYEQYEEYADGEEVVFKGFVARATYGPEGTNQDVTQRVQELIAEGKRRVFGGIHTEIGDPNPGVPKKFKVWYS